MLGDLCVEMTNSGLSGRWNLNCTFEHDLPRSEGLTIAAFIGVTHRLDCSATQRMSANNPFALPKVSMLFGRASEPVDLASIGPMPPFASLPGLVFLWRRAFAPSPANTRRTQWLNGPTGRG
jgi:hypothetical protein